jgi:uncharacterized membrane protein (Fun14 family)
MGKHTGGINMTSNNNQPSEKISYTALGLAIGMILGGIVGLAIDNLIIFAGGGLVLGLAIGYALDNRHKANDA